eukprot:jgi/Psemu1/187644/e_gw1.70.43.1
MATSPVPAPFTSKATATLSDADHRLGHKKRQRARNKDIKRSACYEILGRLPPYQELPLAVINADLNNGNSAAVDANANESKGLPDLYRRIPRLETTFQKFWACVPPVCNPNKAVLEGKISDERELSMDRYHSEKYRRKLKYKKESGDITQTELEELWGKHGKRVENFVSILWDRLSSYTTDETNGNSNGNEFDFTVVDFGSGSGNLCLALAPYFSRVRFVLVDKKPYPLKLVERRANEAGLKNVQTLQYSFSPSNLDDFAIPSISTTKDDLFLPPGTTVEQSTKSFYPQTPSKMFDIAIGLHCCGSFTDMVMSLAKSRGADCIVCPCCNGAMTSKTTCGYQYPRSSYIGKFMNQDEYLSMSKAAEDSGIYEAKCLIEYDRALWANENGYRVQLLKMSPEDCTPKHHVLYLTHSENNDERQ